tara:strand:- start:5722 stop:6339 length:618 start_codon:yes stop_codon:yes gene_type:complete
MVPDISIVITNYNYGKYLSRCVRSCLNQKNVKKEIIVVDDCSTDNSLDILKPFEENIFIFQTEENSGVSFAANLGIQKSRGQFFFRVDADDYINEYMSFIMKTYLEANHGAFCVSSDYTMVDEYENMLDRKYAEQENISCGIMYRRDLFLEAGGYEPKMRHREEEELRKRLGERYSIHHLKIPFYRYRMHKSNKTKEPEYKTWEI